MSHNNAKKLTFYEVAAKIATFCDEMDKNALLRCSPRTTGMVSGSQPAIHAPHEMGALSEEEKTIKANRMKLNGDGRK